jgi:hypothetical protein
VSALAIQGAALFAFIPLVLYLYLRLPMGPGPSLGVGLLLMLGHRFVAGPWALRAASRRCLWCGAAGRASETIEIRAGGRVWVLAACNGPHRDRAARFVTFAARWKRLLAAGIFVPLAVLLAAILALAAGRPFVPQEWAALQFRTIVAATVVTASLGYRSVRAAEEPLSFPFPLHNLCLLGMRATLWVFRAVGIWWLASAGFEIARLIG